MTPGNRTIAVVSRQSSDFRSRGIDGKLDGTRLVNFLLFQRDVASRVESRFGVGYAAGHAWKNKQSGKRLICKIDERLSDLLEDEKKRRWTKLKRRPVGLRLRYRVEDKGVPRESGGANLMKLRRWVQVQSPLR